MYAPIIHHTPPTIHSTTPTPHLITAATPTLPALDTPAIARLAAAMHTPLPGATGALAGPRRSPPSALPAGGAVAAALARAGEEADAAAATYGHDARSISPGEGDGAVVGMGDRGGHHTNGHVGDVGMEDVHAQRVEHAQQALHRFREAARYVCTCFHIEYPIAYIPPGIYLFPWSILRYAIYTSCHTPY